MALLAKDAEGVWVFKHGKYAGKTLEEVCVEAPTYIKWMQAKAADDLSDEAYFEVEDAMEKHNIEPS